MLIFKSATLCDLRDGQVGGDKEIFCHAYAIFNQIIVRSDAADLGEQGMKIVWT